MKRSKISALSRGELEKYEYLTGEDLGYKPEAGNNIKELKNEIRQLLYSLYRSEKISKAIYKHLISII